MFGYQGGESADVVARKKGYLKDAQKRWGFLTTFDLSSIVNPVQLETMIKIRMNIPTAQAHNDVESWMKGKQF